MLNLYHEVCTECSKLITKRYSTSFSLGIRLFANELRSPIYAIYGFVRFADEIVDSFHSYDRAGLLTRFRQQTDEAIDEGISLNPVLHAFQLVVRQYSIDRHLIHSFLDSMEMDVHDLKYDQQLYKKYIYGSAEVVGLMCLKVFLNGDHKRYEALKDSAMSLGSAFQKINFLRDIKDDYQGKGRTYFPDVEMNNFDSEDKSAIEKDIEEDFKAGLIGINGLPKTARFGVFIAYIFYYHLFLKIRKSSYQTILEQRVRIKNRKKVYLLAKYSLKRQLNLF